MRFLACFQCSLFLFRISRFFSLYFNFVLVYHLVYYLFSRLVPVSFFFYPSLSTKTVGFVQGKRTTFSQISHFQRCRYTYNQCREPADMITFLFGFFFCWGKFCSCSCCCLFTSLTTAAYMLQGRRAVEKDASFLTSMKSFGELQTYVNRRRHGIPTVPTRLYGYLQSVITCCCCCCFWFRFVFIFVFQHILKCIIRYARLFLGKVRMVGLYVYQQLTYLTGEMTVCALHMYVFGFSLVRFPTLFLFCLSFFYDSTFTQINDTQ